MPKPRSAATEVRRAARDLARQRLAAAFEALIFDPSYMHPSSRAPYLTELCRLYRNLSRTHARKADALLAEALRVVLNDELNMAAGRAPAIYENRASRVQP